MPIIALYVRGGFWAVMLRSFVPPPVFVLFFGGATHNGRGYFVANGRLAVKI